MTMRAHVLVGWFCVSALAGGVAAQSTAPRPSGVRTAHERAFEDPFDEGRFRAYLATLPRDGDFYVLEGDLLRTAAEVRAYLAAQSQAASRAGTLPELLVNLHQGERDYYAAPSDRKLRYFVDKSSFSSTDRYQRALTAMRKAAGEWQDACPECQIELTEIDAPPAGADARTGFIVRQHDAGGAYIAAAFFPHDPPARRIVNIDPSYFTTSFDSIGVLRHELGHVLGYRHEHTRGITGCGYEDNKWQPLTPYDPHSVMHYFCGGGGSLRLDLSRIDVSGHRALYGGPATSGAFVAPPGNGSTVAADAAQKRDAARSDPFDVEKRQAFLKTLPKVGDYYVVEGDLKMTEQEVTGYLAASASSDQPARRSAELLVNLHGGEPDFYPLGRRKLTYVIDRKSFGTDVRYDTASKAVHDAMDEWEALCSECGIDFDHLKQFDDNPPAGKANFTVRLFDAGGEFIAAAFFPHDPPARRFVDIDPSFYTTTFDKIGVLRHELGHVLGYRHEHIRNVPGCFREDNQWRPLTPYDPRSVMHYFCGGAGNMKLEISATDRLGHHKLYDPPAKTSAAPPVALAEPPAGTLVVSLEGGDVVPNAASALEILYDLKVLPVATHKIAAGEQRELPTVYAEHLRLPSHPTAMAKLARRLNGKDVGQLKTGDPLLYPDVQFIPRTFGKLVSEQEAAQIEQKWKDILIEKGSKKQASQGRYQRIEFRSYELRLPIKEKAKLQEARDRISKLGPYVLAGVSLPATKAKYYSSPSVDASRPADEAPAFRHSGEESILALVGLSEPVGVRKCQGVECPDIILLDKPLQVHPDLKDAIPAQEPDRSLENETLLRDGKETFEVIGWHDTYHATHLAGIIASRRNGFGLVGVDPDARVIWWNWDDLSNNRPEVATMVDRRQREAEVSGAFQIYMFATSWSTQAFNTHTQLISDDTLSKRFNDERALLVVAAGEADARLNQTPQRIELKTTQAPMNQGDQEYVVVVTGCSPCVAPGAQLLPSANHSPTFVHVAAPAKSVLSTAWGTKYAAGDGTSQATAFVAGLASAMVARYPLSYKDAWQVKQRLQVTSTPIELIGPDAQQGEKLAAGIVDPALATSNPKVERLKAKGAAAQEFENLSWNVDNLRMAFVGGGRRTIPTEDIWRIKTVNGKSVVYVRVAPNGAVRTPNGAVQKIGPGTLSTADPRRPIVTLDTTAVMLDDIEDLLLKYPKPAR
jgi:subtilisin family serine protease